MTLLQDRNWRKTKWLTPNLETKRKSSNAESIIVTGCKTMSDRTGRRDKTGAKGNVIHVIPGYPLLTFLAPGVRGDVVLIVWVHTDTMQLLQHGPSGRVTYPLYTQTTHKRTACHIHGTTKHIYDTCSKTWQDTITHTHNIYIYNSTTYIAEWHTHTERHEQTHPKHIHTQV